MDAWNSVAGIRIFADNPGKYPPGYLSSSVNIQHWQLRRRTTADSAYLQKTCSQRLFFYYSNYNYCSVGCTGCVRPGKYPCLYKMKDNRRRLSGNTVW